MKDDSIEGGPMKFVAKVVTKKMDYPYSLGRLLENLSKQSIKTMDARY